MSIKTFADGTTHRNVLYIVKQSLKIVRDDVFAQYGSKAETYADNFCKLVTQANFQGVIFDDGNGWFKKHINREVVKELAELKMVSAIFKTDGNIYSVTLNDDFLRKIDSICRDKKGSAIQTAAAEMTDAISTASHPDYKGRIVFATHITIQ